MPLLVPRYLSTTSPAFAIGLLALGILIGSLAYNLFLAFSTKERMFFHFSAIIALLLVLQTFAAYERFFFYLTYNRVTIITHLLFITFLWFFEDFFSLASFRPGLSAFNRLSMVLILGYTLFFLAAKAIFQDAAELHRLLDFIRELFVFYTNILFITTIASALAWMRTEALLLLIAFIPPAVLTSINAMNIFPFMRRYEHFIEFLMRYNQPVGLSLQAILFSLAMGNRYNRIKLDRQRSEEENKQLARTNDERIEFYTNMSHELRTPLTIILGTIEQLSKGRYGDSIRKNLRQFSVMERNCLRLLRQVSAILRMGQPITEIQPENIPVDSTIRTIVDDFLPVAENRRISLSYTSSEAVRKATLSLACEDLEAIVMNLVSNALKYCPAESRVTIDTSLCNENGDLLLTVSDNGPGIPTEQLEEIFIRYHRGRGTGAYFSSGLGLPLVKTIMESYRGVVLVDSRVGNGTSVTSRFPSSLIGSIVTDDMAEPRTRTLRRLYEADFHDHEVPACVPENKGQDEEQKPHVLVVEDNDDMRSYIASVLSERFYTVPARSGEEALKIMNSTAVDVVVSDIMMPGMNGHEFLAQERRLHKDSPIPFIFLTARNSPVEKVESLQRGAIRYLTKPFVPSELIEGIVSILRHDKELAHSQVERIRKDMEHILRRIDRQDPWDTPVHDMSALALDAFVQDKALSAREQEVVRLIISGMSDKEIAGKMNISPRTVANHNRTIYRKAGVGNRVELIARVLSRATDLADFSNGD